MAFVRLQHALRCVIVHLMVIWDLAQSVQALRLYVVSLAFAAMMTGRLDVCDDSTLACRVLVH